MESINVVYVLLGCVFVFQFYFPILAKKIKNRMGELGYEMQASSFGSMFNTSNFWAEARNKNKDFNDPIIRKYLLVRTIWWALAYASFAAFVSTMVM